ncbi:serine hydrolase domain-containing protein [Rhodococcus spelaei]|uniref:serine hydrolase domain-containing protein n=1 Tax=Rhodococcus spelaei TaxID=2546320 RepID=UPI0015EF3F1D|nr:serine hydrolase domain-containing protein [Rhodococcus spelaei]
MHPNRGDLGIRSLWCGDGPSGPTTARSTTRRVTIAALATALTVASSLGLAGVGQAAEAVSFNNGSNVGDEKEQQAVAAAVQQHLLSIPGSAIAITKPSPDDPGKSIVTTYYVGQADKATGRLVGPDTQFQLDSQTKTFTAALLALRIAQGKAGLNDTAQSHIQANSGATVPTLPSPGGPPITLGELVTHRSGLADYPVNLGAGCDAEATYDVAKLGAGLGLPNSMVFEPGTDWLYSDWGYGLLGSVLTTPFGNADSTFAEAVAKELTGPLLMADTKLETEPNPNLTVLYDDGVPTCYRNNTAALAGAGGLVSTAEDMAKWAVATMGRGPGTLAPTLKKTLEYIAPGKPGTDMQMGMAWQLYPALPVELPYALKNGSGAGSQSVTELVPTTGWSVTVLANDGKATPVAVADQLRRQLSAGGAVPALPAGSSGNTGSSWNINPNPFGS